MAIKNIITRGFGLLPGSVKFIITRGFNIRTLPVAGEWSAIAASATAAAFVAVTVGIVTAYDRIRKKETQWDGNLTMWDMGDDNVSDTDWDVDPPVAWSAV